MKKVLLPLLCLIAITACDDFFETDISPRYIEVIAPTNDAPVHPGQINFRWHEVSHASGYRFLLVAPSFSSAARVIADTLIYADTLSRSYGCTQHLEAGSYAWRVTAFNSGYETSPEEYTLNVSKPQSEK